MINNKFEVPCVFTFKSCRGLVAIMPYGPFGYYWGHLTVSILFLSMFWGLFSETFVYDDSL